MNLEDVKKGVTGCTGCDLCRTRINAVPGRGDPRSGIVFVGEAPGRSEDERGEPFVGAAGKRLSAALEKAGMSRDGVYITNVVKCRPPNNRVPTQQERSACAGHLKNEIEIIGPKIICVMGNTAFRSVLGGTNIMKFRGSVFSRGGLLYFVCLHPAATIYNQDLVKTLDDDIGRLAGLVRKIGRGERIKIDHHVAA